MRKIFLFFLFFILIIDSIYACGCTNTPEGKECYKNQLKEIEESRDWDLDKNVRTSAYSILFRFFTTKLNQNPDEYASRIDTYTKIRDKIHERMGEIASHKTCGLEFDETEEEMENTERDESMLEFYRLIDTVIFFQILSEGGGIKDFKLCGELPDNILLLVNDEWSFYKKFDSKEDLKNFVCEKKCEDLSSGNTNDKPFSWIPRVHDFENYTDDNKSSKEDNKDDCLKKCKEDFDAGKKITGYKVDVPNLGEKEVTEDDYPESAGDCYGDAQWGIYYDDIEGEEASCNSECGGKGEDEGTGDWHPYPHSGWDGPVFVDKNYEGKSFILDNDIFDPDWVIMLQSAIAVDKMGLSKLRGVNISARDSNYKTARLYHSVLNYNGLGNVPIGLLDSHIQTRVNNVDAAKGIDRFDNMCLDKEKCEGKFNSVKLICEILKNSKGKVSYVVGGHLINLAAFLKEKNICNGRKLAEEKLENVVIATGWNSRTSGAMETNLSCPQCNGMGQTEAFSNIINSTKTVFELLPKNVPIIIATIPGIDWKKERPGDYFKNHKTSSPMHYILSVPRYGTFGDHGPSDTEALLYSVYGNKIDGKNFTKQVETCFDIKGNGAAVITNNKCNQFYLEKDTNHYEDIQGAKLNEFMAK